eukprot:gene31033-53270_t
MDSQAATQSPLSSGRRAMSFPEWVTGQENPEVPVNEALAILARMVHEQHLDGELFELFLRSGACMAYARRFLSYLPGSVDDLPARAPSLDPADRKEEFLLSIVPRDRVTPYKSRKIVEACVDAGTFFEMGKAWGRSIITGLARIDGWPVAIMAGDPYVLDGAWTADAARKVERFVDLANTFHLPIVHFVDCPGFAVGRKHEQAGVTRAGIRAMS